MLRMFTAFVVLAAVLGAPYRSAADTYLPITTDTSDMTYIGRFANYASISHSNPDSTLMTGMVDFGSPLNTSVGRITAAGTGMWAYGAYATNEGGIFITSDNGVGMRATVYGANVGTSINRGTIYTQGANTCGMSAVDAILYNSGSIQAQGTGAHAIYADGSSSVYLQEGMRIIAGDVYGASALSSLYLTGSGVVDFDISGAWGSIIKSGSGTWLFRQSPSSVNTNVTVSGGTLALESGVTLALGTGIYTQNPGTALRLMSLSASITAASATVTGGLLQYEPSATDLGSSIAVITTSGGVTGNLAGESANPHFTLVTTNTGNQIVMSIAYTPQWDNTAITTGTALECVQHFVKIPASRSLFLLGSADRTGGEDQVLLASIGSLDGILGQSPEANRFGFYIQPVYGRNEREVEVTSPGYTAIMSGIEIGVDKLLTDDLLVGIMGGYGATDIKFNGIAFAENDEETQRMLTLGVYGGYRDGPWRFADTLSLSRITHKGERNAGLGQEATADYTSWLAGNRLMGEYVWITAKHWELAPQLGINISALHRGSFDEQDATNAVRYDDYDKLFMESILGLRTTGHFEFRGCTLSPFAGVSWNHALADNNITIRQYLSIATAEATCTNDNDSAGLNLGLSLTRGAGRISLEYAGEFSDSVESHGRILNLRFTF